MSEGPSLEAQGLIAHSYDSLFTIRKRLRKINDLEIPIKRGIATNQIGIFMAVFGVMVILYGLVISPLLLLLGIGKTWYIVLTILLGPPILAAQRIAKPMAYGKSIGGSLKSWMRVHVDDPVHRRGVPIPPRDLPSDTPRPHYIREWVMAEPFANGVKGQEPYSDALTENRLMGEVVDLQAGMDARSLRWKRDEEEAKAKRNEHEEEQTHFRRGRAIGVFVPNDTED